MEQKIIDNRVSTRMKQALLANRQGKLHPDQLRELIYEPFVRMLLLLVPAIILLRSFLLTLFVGGLWMIGAVAVIYGAIQLYRRRRRYLRLKIFYGVFYRTDKIAHGWKFWRPVEVTAESGKTIQLHRSLAPEKQMHHNQGYIVYYTKDFQRCILLSFAPIDHIDIDQWKP